jgi:hypothetical protein
LEGTSDASPDDFSFKKGKGKKEKIFVHGKGEVK